MKNNNSLYIFLHVPKTAGTTFMRHVEAVFKKNECLNLEAKHFSPQTGKFDNFKGREEVDRFLNSLPEKQKNKIKIIHGHHRVYYGIHRFFDKNPKYFTFLRDPVDRVISVYNYLISMWDIEAKRKIIYSQTGKILSFFEWIHSQNQDPILNGQNGMTRMFYEGKPKGDTRMFCIRNLEGETGQKYLEEAKRTLDKFYFIGITKNFDEDSLFLYYKLGIKRFFGSVNISTRYFHHDDYEKTKEIILQKNKLDKELYSYALEINRKFKEGRKDFYRKVFYMRFRRLKQTLLSAPFWMTKASFSCIKQRRLPQLDLKDLWKKHII